MADFENVHFWGVWSESDKAHVAAAIDAYETQTGPSPLPEEIGKPWIAVAHDLPKRGLYCFAKRIRIGLTFTGRTPNALASAIRGGIDDGIGAAPSTPN